jgi:hypothetical protein
MSLKEVLIENNIPLPEDFDERMDFVIAALRRSPDYPEKLKKMSGGGLMTSEDWWGPNLRWFVNTMTTPLARTAWRGLFAIVFFVSYVESIPILGSLIAVALDLLVMNSKMLIKSIQRLLPPMFGLIPLPYTSVFGMILASLFGIILWPILSIISFSRQDFTAAIDSYVRIIPPPIGDGIADIFLEGNRTVAKLNEKRIAFSNDISKVFQAVGSTVKDVTGTANTLAEKTREAATQLNSRQKVLTDKVSQGSEALAGLKAKAKALKGGKRLSRRVYPKDKWHKTTRRRSVRR